MATNPLFRNEFYFFSNMYDDRLITEFYRKISAESYQHSKEYQQAMLGRKVHPHTHEIFYKATLGDFKVDDKFNNTVGLPIGSRVLSFDTLILPVFNKKKFLNTYGVAMQKIPLVDFLSRNDIFDKNLVVQIGKYRIMSMYIIQDNDKKVYLAVANNNTDGVLTKNFDEILNEYTEDEPVWVFTTEITAAFYENVSYASAVNTASGITGRYDVKIARSSNINASTEEYIRGNYQWECLCTFNNGKYGRKVLVSTDACVRTINSSHVFFSVPESFLNMIKSTTPTFNIWFICKPYRTEYLYKYDANTSPLINLSYKENPVENINVELYEYDTTTACRGRRLYDPKFTQSYFPNIFDFSKLNKNNSDLLIDFVEYPSTMTNQIMQNSISPLIESLGSDRYTEYVVNGHDKNRNGISCGLSTYYPKYYPISAEDYIASEYHGDLRGYMLDKIYNIIASDPYLIHSYYKFMIENCQEMVVSKSGTPSHFLLGTGKTGEFGSFAKQVTDTSIASVTSDDIQYFAEPHCYITYRNSTNKCIANLYVNGKYVRPTCHRLYKGLNYIFIPVKYINTEMSVYKTDEELKIASPITVDIYPNTYLSIVDAPKDTISIDNMVDPVKFFEWMESAIFSIDEIIIYDSYTGKYLGSILDLFDITLSVSDYRIKNPGQEDEVLLTKGEDIQYLLTVLNELYNTMDNQAIIVSEPDVDLKLNDFINDMIDAGVIKSDEKSSFTHKKIDFKDLKFIPKSETLVGKTLSIYNRSFKSEYKVNPTDGIYDEETKTTIFTLDSFSQDPDLSRYYVFIDGYLQFTDPEYGTVQLVDIDNKFTGNIKLVVKGNMSTEGKDILIVHFPIGYSSEVLKAHHYISFMDKAANSGIETSDLWPLEGNGMILQSNSTIPMLTKGIEDNYNMKFLRNTTDNTNYRMPPMSKNSFSINRQYYDKDRSDYIESICDKSNKIPGGAAVLFSINTDYPAIDLAKYNIYDKTLDKADYDKLNPLDILSYQ